MNPIAALVPRLTRDQREALADRLSQLQTVLRDEVYSIVVSQLPADDADHLLYAWRSLELTKAALLRKTA